MRNKKKDYSGAFCCVSQIAFFKHNIGFWKNFTENFTESLIISQKSCF